MKPYQRTIELHEFNQLFTLIDNNRSRIEVYFPNTSRAIKSPESARVHLKECLDRRANREQFLLGIYLEEKLIGYLNIKNIDWEVPKCELGYFIDREHEGKGIMSQEIGKALNFCFEQLKMEKVFLRIGEDNKGSIALAEKIGFVKEGHLRKDFRTSSGQLIDILYYGKTRT